MLQSGVIKNTRILLDTNLDEEEVQVIRDKLNRGVFTSCQTANSLARVLLVSTKTLQKATIQYIDRHQDWFNEQNPPLLQRLSENQLMLAVGEQEFVSMWEGLQEPCQAIFRWLLVFLSDVLHESATNQVTVKELGE